MCTLAIINLPRGTQPKHVGISIGEAGAESGISDIAASHGTAVEEALTSVGVKKDNAMIAGAITAGLSSITVAPLKFLFGGDYPLASD
jgi:hypothetical protein